MSGKKRYRHQVDRDHVSYKWQGHKSGLPKSPGVHILLPQAPDAGHGVTRLTVCLIGFQSCFVPFFLTILLSFPFRIGMFTL
jgi:hypothetical protein